MTKTLCALACAAFGAVALAAPAEAAVAPSVERVDTPREKSLRRIRRLLDQKAVRRRLAKVGRKREDIEKSLAKLNDAELEKLADRLDNLAMGRGALGVVIAILVIAALVLLIIYLAERI